MERREIPDVLALDGDPEADETAAGLRHPEAVRVVTKHTRSEGEESLRRVARSGGGRPPSGLRQVVGGGLDRTVPEEASERLAEWLGAAYEPFGAHSHYGLVIGEQSHQQVADAIRSFLDANRL